MQCHCAGGEAGNDEAEGDNEDVTTKEDAKPDGLVSAYWEAIGMLLLAVHDQLCLALADRLLIQGMHTVKVCQCIKEQHPRA